MHDARWQDVTTNTELDDMLAQAKRQAGYGCILTDPIHGKLGDGTDLIVRYVWDRARLCNRRQIHVGGKQMAEAKVRKLLE